MRVYSVQVPSYQNCNAGSVLPIAEIIDWSHNVGAKVLVDACQSVPHMVVDVRSLNADFLVASSHKVWLLPCILVLKPCLSVHMSS